MRARLILSFVFIMLVSIVSVVLIARRSTAREIQAFMYRGTMTDLDSLVQELQEYYEQYGSWTGVESLFPGADRGTGRGQRPMGMSGMMSQRLLLAETDGTILIDTDGVSTGNQFSAAEQNAAQELQANGRIVGYLLLEGGMGFNSSESLSLVNRLNRAALIAAGIAGGLALLLAFILSDRLIRPIRELTDAAQRMAQGDLTQRVPAKGKDELARLGLAFNHMADSLEQAVENRKAMTADIAHELRNPLAVQRAHLEALQDGIYPPTAENLQPVYEQNLLLTRLVDDLRILALADAGQLELDRTSTDVVSLVGQIVVRFSPQAAAHDIHLSYEVSPGLQSTPLMISADPLRLEQILGNLLSNAQRHTPPGAKIVVQITSSANQVVVKVSDSGPGISPEALPHIFERFYRADHARSRSEGGSGLGLAIARQLAEMHGGSLTAANAPQGGAVFTLALPREL